MRDPWTASTYGTGELIAQAINAGASRVLVAAGGSATTDGGLGAVEALRAAGGTRGAQLVVLSDVTATFTEAARIFGAQKGADAGTIERLTDRLVQQARKMPRDPSAVPGSGAAGGLSGGLWAHFGAQLVSGADFVLDAIDFDLLLAEATCVVVGEGRLDGQTMGGKIISAILARVQAHSRDLPVHAVVGSVGSDFVPLDGQFAKVIVASDATAMAAAGRSIITN